MSWAIPESCAALPCAKPKFFGGRKRGLVQGRCAVLAIFGLFGWREERDFFKMLKGS